MNPQALIFLPVTAMAVLVAIVIVFMLRERITEMKTRRIHPQKVASSSQMSATLHNTRAADNYKNLFEMPVLFYALCMALYATQQVSHNWLLLAWVYVGLRCLHSAIHVGYNTVMHRFAVFGISSGLLLGMWISFSLQITSRG